jgi:hypothetical protein
VSKNKIHLDELLSKVDSDSSGKQGKRLPFAIVPVVLMQNFSTLEWSKSFDKFDVVLGVKFSEYTGVCPLLPQTPKRPPNAGAIDLRMLQPMRNPRRVATCNQQRMCYSILSIGQSAQSSTTVPYPAARFRVLVIGNVVLSYLYPHALAYSFVVAERCREIFPYQ